MPSDSTVTRRRSVLFCAAASLFASHTSRAAEVTWANTGISWNDANNWVGGVAPANSTTMDIAVFEGSPVFQPFLNQGRSIGALDLRASGYEFSGSRITLGSGIPKGREGINSTNNASGTVLFNNGLIVSSSHAWNSSLNLTGAASIDFNGTSATRTLTINSTGSTIFAGDVFLISNASIFTRTITLAGSGDVSIPSVIQNTAGTANFAISSTGTVRLTGANTFNGSTILNSGTLVVNSDASFGAAPAALNDAIINVTGNATVRLDPGVGALALHPNRGIQIVEDKTLSVVSSSGTGALGFGSITLASGASLDVNDNDLVVTGTPRAQVEASIVSARNGGAWDGTGITSTSARTHPNQITTLATLSGAEYSSVGGTATFSDLGYAAADTLVKYTYYGDTDFNGIIDFDDYVRADLGFNTDLTGWLNGDFNSSGNVDFDDYVLIDSAFNLQNGTLIDAMNAMKSGNAIEIQSDGVELVRAHAQRFGEDYVSAFLSQVPEPASFCAMFSGLMCVILRRKRRASGVVSATSVAA